MQTAIHAAALQGDDFTEENIESTINVEVLAEKNTETKSQTEESSAQVIPFFTSSSIFGRLKAAYGMHSRASQNRLAYLVKEGLIHELITCVEAPTGTGKTLGYLAGAIEARYRTKKLDSKPAPLVIATATVALQNQIMTQDIPRLEHAGILNGMKVALAKGRGRYFCARNAQLVADKSIEESQMDWLDETKGQIASSEQVIVKTMFKKWKEKEWDGDIDHWEGETPKQWNYSCAASSQTCVLRACEYYAECPYLQSRAEISQADIVIANHDLVLSDLLQRKEDENKGALPLNKYQLIIDEAHQFPDKAIETRKSITDLTDIAWLAELPDLGNSILRYPQLEKALKNNPEANAASLMEGSFSLSEGLQELTTHLSELQYADNGSFTWGEREIPEELKSRLRLLNSKVYALAQTLQLIVKFLTEKGQDAHGSEKGLLTHLLGKTNFYYHLAKSLNHGIFNFCGDLAVVRWAEKTDKGYYLNTQPMNAGPILDEILWSKERTVVLVSATMQVNNSFERFRNKIHLPLDAATEALPPVFDYARGFLHLPRMECNPNDKGYLKEMREKLEKILAIHSAKGVLVLFTSRKTMSETAKNIQKEFKSVILEQGTRPMPELITEHKQRIDQGERSILFGLDTMAEGLDLPGKYCEQVVITRLPFGNPQDPVEQARQESLGQSWFANVYLCDMIIRLTQACGRLIRRETDKGVITILDKRLSTKQYGQTAISSLPQFSRCNKLQVYLDDDIHYQ